MVSVHALVTVGGAVTKSGARVCASSVTDELKGIQQLVPRIIPDATVGHSRASWCAPFARFG